MTSIATVVSTALSVPSAIYNLKAQLLSRTADFYRLSPAINKLGTQLRSYEQLRTNVMTPGERAKLAVAQQAVVQANSQFGSTNAQLSQVSATLGNPAASAADLTALIVNVPKVIAGMAATQQLVDGASKLTSSLVSALPATDQQKVGGSSFPIGTVLVIGGLAFLIFGGRRS